MTAETSVGAIIFNKQDKVLLLKRADKEKYWEFPKGHKLPDEDDLATLKRELKEECGITEFKNKSFKEQESYINSKGNKRIFIYYLIEYYKDIKLSKEHDKYKWFSREQALSKLVHKNWKILLNKAYEHIRK